MAQMMKPEEKVKNVRTMLERLKPQIALALPKHLTPDRLARVAMTTILRTPKLLDCDQTSLAGAIITCSQLGLEPDPVLGHAYLVPFRNRKRGITEVVVIPGFKGLMKLARNSGEIATFDAHVVRQRDTFRYAFGLKPTLHHVPFQGPLAEAGEVTHYYAVATMKSGGGQFVVMTRAEVEAHRDRFARAVDDDSPWRTEFDAMAMKTCIRGLAKYLPASVELQRAAALDEQAEAGIPQDLGSAVIDLSAVPETSEAEPEKAASTKLDALVEKLKADPGDTHDEPSAVGSTERAPESKESGSDATAPVTVESERASLLVAIDERMAKLKISPAATRQAIDTYCGKGVALDKADPSALTDLLGWLKTRAGEAA